MNFILHLILSQLQNILCPIPQMIYPFKHVSSHFTLDPYRLILLQAMLSVPSPSCSSQTSLSVPYTHPYLDQTDSGLTDAQIVSPAIRSSSASSGPGATDSSTADRNRSRRYEEKSRKRLRESSERLAYAVYDRRRSVASTRQELYNTAADIIMFVSRHLRYIPILLTSFFSFYPVTMLNN